MKLLQIIHALVTLLLLVTVLGFGMLTLTGIVEVRLPAKGQVGERPGELTIIEIPRPNSGTYTTEEATTLLPKTIARSRAVDPENALVAEWKNPTHGFRVHVTANNDIETVNFFGKKQSGMDGLTSALKLSEAMQHGNPLSVLLTSETDGWQTDKKNQIVETLFRPSIQLYIVTDK